MRLHITLFLMFSLFVSGCFIKSTETNGAPKLYQVQPSGAVYVPSGVLNLDGEQITINAFWIQDTEVTNGMYLQFLNSLSLDSQQQFLPNKDTLQHQLWVTEYADYLTNEWFLNYPVAGLTKNQMQAYAKWLSAETRKEFDEWPFKYQFRLPTKAEWIFAAKGGANKKYAWNYSQIANTKGCYLANFFNPKKRSTLQEKYLNVPYYSNGILEEWVKEKDFLFVSEPKKWRRATCRKKGYCDVAPIGIPYRSDSYFPNDYGLYSMGGNMAELTSDSEVMGGSFRLPAEYATIKDPKPYPFDSRKAQSDLGFRLVCSYEQPVPFDSL